MRASNYTIYADLPDRSDVLLIHGYSGAYDVVTREVANYLRAQETVKPEKPMYGVWAPELASHPVVSPSGETIEHLRRRGYLTEKTVEEEAQVLDKLAASIHARKRMPGYVLMTTYDCNLRCHYCFQDHMRTDPAFGHLLKAMTPELFDRIIAALPELERRHEVPAENLLRTFLFFGGEPLLASSRPNVEYFMRRTQALSATRFQAISNATELDAYRGLLGPGQIDWLQITLDGPPEEHDKRRIRADGTGSWAAIAKNVTFALEQGCQISVRMNIDRNNIGQLDRLAEEMLRLGWLGHPQFSAGVAAIHASNDKTVKSSTFDSHQLGAELKRLAVERPVLARFAVPSDALKSRISAILRNAVDPRTYLHPEFCTAHTSMYVFDALGDIYACWERTGDERVRIGWLDDSGPVFPGKADPRPLAPTGRKFLPMANAEPVGLDAWRDRTVSTNPTCRKCRYALQCGGGCAAAALNSKQKYLTNYCNGFQNSFRTAAAEAYLAHEQGERIDAPVSACGAAN
ncbi:MAG: radical SAM protein [Kofleriaceae bacterium]